MVKNWICICNLGSDIWISLLFLGSKTADLSGLIYGLSMDYQFILRSTCGTVNSPPPTTNRSITRTMNSLKY